MRLAFDASPLIQDAPVSAGVTRAARGLLAALRERGRHEWVELAPEPGRAPRAWRQLDAPREVRAHGCRGFHSTVSALPLRGRFPCAQTVHELPWLHGAHENSGFTHRFWAAYGAHRARFVVVPSERVLTDLRAWAPHAGRRAHATPWGIEPTFLATELERPGCGQPSVLMLGGTRRKKRLDRALAGLAHCADRQVRLHVTGPETPWLAECRELANRLDLSDRLVHTPHVDESELPALVAASAAVLVLSDSEGFGFPALEALACGRPAIVARGSVSEKHCGEHAVSIRLDDEHELASAIRKAVHESGGSATARRAHAATFTWARCAERIESLWEEHA